MTGSLAELLPVSVLEPDGLIVTTAGRYVRLIECERVPNAVTADPVTLAAIERAYANVCRAIPDHQQIVVYAQTDPVPLKEALEGDVELARAASSRLSRRAGGSLSRTHRGWRARANSCGRSPRDPGAGRCGRRIVRRRSRARA